jgi:protoporphyrinogen oxidase
MMDGQPVIIVGAGPGGLTAAHELVRHGQMPVVLEQGDRVGGIARTETYRGYRFDIGGHRFYTKVPEIQRLWNDVLGDDFRPVARLSRIHYRDRFYQYPLEPVNAVSNLGVVESGRMLFSYVKSRVRPLPVEDTFEQWVTNRFGERLYATFFKTYTEKVWGISCREIRADWAAQRIRGLSLRSAVSHAVFGNGEAKTLIRQFHYPVLGPGQMWERMQQRVVARGGHVRLNTEVVRIRRERGRVRSVVVRQDDRLTEIAGSHFLSTMPLSALVLRMDPPAPAAVQEAARQLRYRDFIIVGLIISRPHLFADNWLYIHTPGVSVGRIQNFKNWSAALVPDAGATSLGMEYFCNEGDPLWRKPDAELIALATRELAAIGLACADDVTDGVVIRQPKAYPVYDAGYRRHLQTIRDFLATLDNLQTLGRNGMHRYNNQDHSMLTGLLAVRNLLGDRHDLWNVNTERSYYEEFQTRSAA